MFEEIFSINENVNDQKGIYIKLIGIRQRFMELSCEFVAVFDIKCNGTDKEIMKWE